MITNTTLNTRVWGVNLWSKTKWEYLLSIIPPQLNVCGNICGSTCKLYIQELVIAAITRIDHVNLDWGVGRLFHFSFSGKQYELTYCVLLHIRKL